MNKTSSRRSSVAGSVQHVYTPRESSTETLIPEESRAGEDAPSISQLSLSNGTTNKSPDVVAETSKNDAKSVGESEFVSNPAAKETASNENGTAITYGTRSRNRTGTSRPNYAEDKEVDAELEVAASTNGRRGARGADSSTVSENGRTSNARKDQLPEPNQLLSVQALPKGPIPGTSTFSANTGATLPITKKRKTNNQYTINRQALEATAQDGSFTQAVTRRASTAVQRLSNFPDSNMLSFETCAGRLKKGKLVADDGTVLEVNDHAYLVCEPPGEAYYLGRIMEFLHVNNDSSQPIDALRLNWYYRPKDIGRKVNDTRQVFASMHSDVSPLTALRGKCQIKHKSEVEKLDDLRRSPDSFWYEKLYDRYIHRYYDVVPTSQVINVPVEVKKVLDERWKFIIVEPGRGKELTSAVKSCKRCNKYCASNDSVDCAVCRNTYHMSCVCPPLLKKPSRGFAWACGPCSKAQEKKLEARLTPNVNDATDEEEIIDEDASSGALGDTLDTGVTSPAVSSIADLSVNPGTAEQIHQASLWLFRYLGIHCKVEDALDYDDRIYPRASTRLGPKYQANVPAWPGRPVEYIKPLEIKRKYVKGGGQKKAAQLSKETIAALEAEKIAREKRPKWVMDEPPGYISRGEDYPNDDLRNTAQLLYKLPESDELPEKVQEAIDEPLSEAQRERFIMEYMASAAFLGQSFGLPPMSTNLLDIALQYLHDNDYDSERALHALTKADAKVFKEPNPSLAEQKKFEDGVTKYGSEWYSIKKHVKTMKPGDIVRYYYTWKKTDRGKYIWGNYSGRKGKKEAKRAEASVVKLQDDVADEHDDSAFDNMKASEKKRGFQCKFCDTKQSRQWRRAPNTAAGTMVSDISGVKTTGKDKGTHLMVALCRRCAELWRRYAIQWEDIDQVAKNVALAGGRQWKRKIDEELLKELEAANQVSNVPDDGLPMLPLLENGMHVADSSITGLEPPRKKLKGSLEKDTTEATAESVGLVIAGKQKKLLPVKSAPPPPPPEPPKPKIMPCAICGDIEPMGDQHLSCKDCRMTVHRNCYGVLGDNRGPGKWVCDMCSNDRNPQVSIQYKCMLCPIESSEHDFVEPPKSMPKKKSEKDREKDRVEREQALKVAEFFKKKQEEQGKPINPREPLKRTANNNWVHVICAVFTPEVKFGSAKALEPSEGIPSISSARYEEVCKVCKKNNTGACVSCHSCKTPVHVGCAHQAGYALGFDVTPVKGSRRDQANTVTLNGETGAITAAVWCKEHVPTKSKLHLMNDAVTGEVGLNALQLYVQKSKQADLTLTGTVRKATLVYQSTKAANPAPVAAAPNRRTSTTSTVNGRGSISNIKVEEAYSVAKHSTEKACITCEIDVSPKWWPYLRDFPEDRPATPLEAPKEPNGIHDLVNGIPLINGHGLPTENGGTHVALAAAALHQNKKKLAPAPTEFQCHQCHFKKIRLEESIPPPAPPSPSVLMELSPPPPPPPPVIPLPVPTPVAEPIQAPPAQYAWPPPQPPSYPPNNHSYNWPHRSPAPSEAHMVNQLNGNHSPRMTVGSGQLLNGDSQIRPSPLPPPPPNNFPPRSPHQNGHLPQVPNGYPLSPHHRGMGSPSLHMSNGSYPMSYPATRPPPPPPPHSHQMMNGGPPPRVQEQSPFRNDPPMQHRLSFGQSHSPPMFREPHLPQRDHNNPQNNSRSNDGRVNGGASTNPSLKNLLSWK